MKTKFALFAAAAMLTACASPTGVVPIGSGIFMASKMGAMTYSGGQVKAELYKEAGEYCATSKKQVVPLASTSQDASLGTYASAEIQFRCE